MTDTTVSQIHARTLEVLRDVGLVWPHRESLEELGKKGFDVDYAKRVVRMQPGRVESALEGAPRNSPLYTRDGRDYLHYENGPFLMGAGTGVAVVDPETGERRPSTCLDIVQLVRIQDALPNLDIARPIIAATDVPDIRHGSLFEYALALCNTGKHVTHRILDPVDVEPLMEIGAAIAGGMDGLRERPIFSGLYCPLSPLGYTTENATCMVEFARRGIPVMVLSETIPGVNAPATLLGPVIVTNAEIIGTLTLLHNLFPEAPVMYAGIITLMNMRSGTVTYGGPEKGAMNALAGMMARHYGLVSILCGLRTDAKQGDVQAGFEKASNVWPILPHVDIVYGLGNLDTGLTCAYDQLVLDDELMSAAKRYLEWSRPVGDGSFEMELIRQVGPMRDFLALEHTAKEARNFWRPDFFTRETYADWEVNRHDAAYLARERAKKLLKEHTPPPLPPETMKEIRRVLGTRADGDFVARYFGT